MSTAAGLRQSSRSLLKKQAKRTLNHSLRLSSTTTSQVTLGLRREDPARIWERRCPLTPDAVSELVEKDGVRVLVQDCDRRVFPVDEFVKAGATIHPTLEPAHVILGIKETPLNELVTTPVASDSGKPMARTQLMFSHTIKGQPYNMELLSRFLGTGEDAKLLPRLIDYELLTGEDGKRTVGFGWFAGVAGALESLSAMSQAHLEMGIASPFLHTPRPHTHPSIPSIRAALKGIGEEIKKDGTPKSLGPFVIASFLTTGQVTQGCLSILQDLPIVNVKVEDLPALVSNPGTNLHQVYLVHALPKDYLTRPDGGQFLRDHYYRNPDQYKSEFDTKVAPYLTLLLNGVGWQPSFPRLMTNEQLATALTLANQVGPARFRCIGDISCDIQGGLEFLPRESTVSEPFFNHRPEGLPAHLPSVQIMSVDILPTTLPLDASQHFCGVLMPYLRSLIKEYKGEKNGKEHAKSLNRATVARHGVLQSQHAWLEENVNKWRAESGKTASAGASAAVTNTPKKKVLLLGSGMVAGPTIDELCKHQDVEMIVASNLLSEADNLTKHHQNAKSQLLDVSDATKVGELISQADLVISLLPVPFHPQIAELCIQHKKHMVTASYISAQMRELNDKAEAANVLLLNEIGLDPGIDHCSTYSLLDKLKSENKRVTSYISFCGGLPAPEHADVPLGYKFSWSPKGVLTAAKNSAVFKLNGKPRHIFADELLRRYFPDVPISNTLKFEGLANRDSNAYIKTYDLPKSKEMSTMLRGTLRYPGFADLMQLFKGIGLLSSTPETKIQLESWNDLTRQVFQSSFGVKFSKKPSSLESAFRDIMSIDDASKLLQALEWLEIAPSKDRAASRLPPVPKQPTLPIDLLATILAHKLAYAPGERDMVVMSHEVVASGEKDVKECHTADLVVYGTPRASAMSLCVGLPVAFAAREILSGKVRMRGVRGPSDPSVYTPVLDGLAAVGIGMKENVKLYNPGMESVLAKGLERPLL
ncbi:hypothetical protein CONPUDRAFT_128756 [Coniophora puteana RWD-64-598 SS2]|uniref:Alanine dehydrogenase/pyridine nucleotide transhydrogenase N-terminal domain-containing protein n=1 Tax=Coniophora puteana (strain RWD-64-598) TaxID=741705 RepID=A0A5M3MFS3_CONPW|nr:uncharacterized protein CONPUDRAFT_128756 [Coniophora puteana RWD-64-598 SS2]EIW77770.1 hypothetical protein CONPUDRAFT_128756 [Coniophora puteana RWD-64-598 SS2]